ncbi:YdeI/OmpD-associated family protein [Streptomyces ferrugineus]|uniref:YdeI/OmpD-associated family protein n=1 Tax=Streptomyces ferrugineus TaxID=1413221 RepID=A0A7M2SG98_9ACTN|nr:YdeI/OmpD-associated family protein [Streptomyces ferrugineus]QOV35334.1 YdeI/OmpD-associated family protein [Streptomyces ferrugineus]
MSPHRDPEPRAFVDAPALDSWLAEHPAPHPGLWVKVAKQGSGIPSVTAAEVNDVALCHGWITGQRKGIDGSYYAQRITPRRPGSLWSMVNVRRVAELAAEGRMRPAGFAEVDAAKADGRWDAAYESQRKADVPDELTAALEEDPRARAAFEGLGRTERYQIMLGLLRARTARIRQAQVAAILRELARRR